MTPPREVLVIKLSALGDFILAFAAFQRIRAAHRGARITLLTTPSFESLARASPYFDAVETDGRPKSLAGWLRLVSRLRAARYDRVYDLQTNNRTNGYFQALRPFPPAWSGTAFGCAPRHGDRDRMTMHVLERQARQLQIAGIWPDAPTAPLSGPPPDVSWMLSPGAADPKARLALLVPGGAVHRPEKRWPARHFASLAQRLQAEGFSVAVIGAVQERDLAKVILAAAPGTEDLTGRTPLPQLAALGAHAALAVGNDTGPLHLIAAAGAPSVVLFSSASDPALCAPRGRVSVLRSPCLDDLSVDLVLAEALSLSPPAA